MADFECKEIFEYFNYLSSVPHGSYNTEKIRELCAKFADSEGLSHYSDEAGNIIIYKEASAGYENAEPLIIQCHLDMVCVKTPEASVDMATEPVKILSDGEWIFAEGTSLGSDDIAGAAIALAVLGDDTLPHPPLEVLFTADEEVGMKGADMLDVSLLKGKRLLNIDSEEEGCFTCGCAGGARLDGRLKVAREKKENYKYYSVTVDGLLGGHSGMEIDKERASSHIIAARILLEAYKKHGALCAEFYGGEFDNAIPSKTHSRLAVPERSAEAFVKTVENYGDLLKKEYSVTDAGMRITLRETECGKAPLTKADTAAALKLLISLPNGVQNMSGRIKGLVETSLNMGIVSLKENELCFGMALRSSVGTRKRFLEEKVSSVIEAFGGEWNIKSPYPEWEFSDVSPLRDIIAEAYRSITRKEGIITATHGGLECGIFSEKIKGLDCVSIGPDITGAHSVNEKLNIKSFIRTYRLVRQVIENCK